jgi:hypothetical protein
MYVDDIVGLGMVPADLRHTNAVCSSVLGPTTDVVRYVMDLDRRFL